MFRVRLTAEGGHLMKHAQLLLEAEDHFLQARNLTQLLWAHNLRHPCGCEPVGTRLGSGQEVRAKPLAGGEIVFAGEADHVQHRLLSRERRGWSRAHNLRRQPNNLLVHLPLCLRALSYQCEYEYGHE